MGGIFGKPSKPKPQPLPPPQPIPEVAPEAEESAARQARRKGGFMGTIITGSLTPKSKGKKTVLG